MGKNLKNLKKTQTCLKENVKKGKRCTICGHHVKRLYEMAGHMQTHTNERPFKCSICETSFRRRTQLGDHVRYVHGMEKRPKSNRKECVFCLKLISTCDMYNHIRSHIKEKPFSCSICEKEFISNTSVAYHMKSHFKIQGAPCVFCEKTFSVLASPDDHLRSHIKEKPFFCTKCPWSFSQQGNLSTHIRKVHLKERDCVCNICGKSLVKCQREAHIRSHFGETPFQCHICRKRFKSEQGLRGHLKAHNEINHNSFPCPKCNNSYANMSNLRRHEKETHQTTQCALCEKVVPRNMFMNHIKSHWKEKSFSCTRTICTHGLQSKKERALHLQSQHSNFGKVSVVCVFCSKVFPTSQLLEQHVRSYNSAKTFFCKKCPISFAFYIDLRSHERRVHPRKRTFFCVICEMGFRTSTEIQYHVAKHLKEEPFECRRCDMRFRFNWDYKRHLKRH